MACVGDKLLLLLLALHYRINGTFGKNHHQNINKTDTHRHGHKGTKRQHPDRVDFLIAVQKNDHVFPVVL